MGTTTDQPSTHVVISAPSQWGQQACDHLLHRAVADGGRVTLIVPRRERKRFESWPPTIQEWEDQPSLKAVLEQRRASGRPIDYVYDDQCNHLAAELISQQTARTHLTVGYVTSNADEHFNHADYLLRFCERVLVEKPVSRLFDEIRPDGKFPRLAASLPPGRFLATAEHFLFRPGVTRAWRSGTLQGFFERHQECDLHYEFQFEEPEGRDDPAQRLGAYQDGSILDILATHGLGPVACLLLPFVAAARTDFYTGLVWRHVRSWQAKDPRGGMLKIPVLAETAAELHGRLSLSPTRTLHLHLRSAKGCRERLRFFRFYCPAGKCRSCLPGVREDRVRDLAARPSPQGTSDLFVAVSLGSAGYTVFDYSDATSLDRLFVEVAGGYLSDRRGSSVSEAANAQAAMLDALLQPDFGEEEKRRFVPVETACQIVRAGLRAQGVAFNRAREPYYAWGEGPKWPSEPASQTRKSKLVQLHSLTPGIDQLADVLRLRGDRRRQRPYHRVVTVLGPEGAGNSDIARALRDSELAAEKIDIPRDEDWEQGSSAAAESHPPSGFTLEMVLRKLASKLHLSLTTARRPAEELPAYLRKVRQTLTGTDLLLFNGVDRLSANDWHVLVRILNELPASYRMIFVTKTWERAGGFVVRTEELMNSLPGLLEGTRALPLGDYFPTPVPAGGRLRKQYERLFREEVLPFSRDNLTVRQQVASWVFYMALPAALRKAGLTLPASHWWDLRPYPAQPQWDLVREFIQDEIASLDLPSPLTANPEAFLDRVSRLCLAMVSDAQRQAVRSLATVSGEIPKRLVDEVSPGLFDELRALRPARALFEIVTEDRALLFPRVRKAVLESEPEDLDKLRTEIERRRLLLSLRRLRLAAPDRAVTRALGEQMIRLLYGASLETLNLDGTPFESLCMELVEELETSSDLHGDQAAGSLIELLTDEATLTRTNLGLLARARLTRLKGWLLRGAAGVDPAQLQNVAKVLDHAYALAQHCVERKDGLERTPDLRRAGADRCPLPGEVGRDGSSPSLETLVLTTQGRVFAGMVQSRWWHRLLGLKTTPHSKPQDWEAFVTPRLEVGTAGPGALRRTLWELCEVGIEQRGPRPPELSPKVFAIALRALALYVAGRETGPDPLLAARLCLRAAKENAGNEDCQARNLMEAALFLSDGTKLADEWDLAPAGTSLTRTYLGDRAKEIFDQERDVHPGLAPYIDLLDLMVESGSAAQLLAHRKELKRLEAAFERTGDGYFGQLVHDLRAAASGSARRSRLPVGSGITDPKPEATANVVNRPAPAAAPRPRAARGDRSPGGSARGN